jgi:glyoxylase-like metal-dependent hydrolase (beta-lactamase superfamily II)
MPTRTIPSYDLPMQRPLELSPTARWWPAAIWQTTTLELERDGIRLLVDPGVTPDEVREVAGDRPVDHILITHADWDHVMGIGLLPDATVHAGRLSAERIGSGASAAEVRHWAPAYGLPVAGLEGMRTDRVIDPPADVAIGPWQPTVRPVPGHMPDCIATWLPEEGLLVAGDYLSPHEIPFAYHSVAGYLDALAELTGIIERERPRWVVIGHGQPLDADRALTIASEDLEYLGAVLDYARSGGDPERPDLIPHPQRGGEDDEDEHAGNVRRACEQAAAG